MKPDVYREKVTIKVAEYGDGRAYISFDEYVGIPGLESADIRIEFDKKLSFEEVLSLTNKLKDAGFTFVVQFNH